MGTVAGAHSKLLENLKTAGKDVGTVLEGMSKGSGAGTDKSDTGMSADTGTKIGAAGRKVAQKAGGYLRKRQETKKAKAKSGGGATKYIGL
jgi:hypothetical protein